uniref:Glycosyltransferase family 92 protein n=1 Tax=Haemonchus contortus TaxID=6289 RepID=A0A7I4YEX4_HAECO
MRKIIGKTLHVARTIRWRLVKLFSNAPMKAEWLFRFTVILLCILCGLAWYHRTINMWALKNIGDTFLVKDIGTRQIILGVFQRQKSEQNVNGKFAVIHFLGDGRMEHPLYCFSKQPDNRYFVSHAAVQRIHRGKRASSDICSWAGHIAECELEVHTFKEFRIGVTPHVEDAMIVTLEQPLRESRHDLVVCMAPMYIYTDWETLLVGIETWVALGATKIIVPVQSASTSSYRILQEYEKRGLVIIRTWPKWPVLSDSNPNGLVLSRGIEESHVNCLFFAKPWANMIVFSDIDDLLLPVDPLQIKPGINVEILKNLFAEHPQAGSLLFEHRDVQFQLPVVQDSPTTLASFNFNFLTESKHKMNCNVWRMKTRVVVNASRVDSVNMHETGIHRFGYVQTRIPCRKAHFYHLRHSHHSVPNPLPIDMSELASTLNRQWYARLESFKDFKDVPLNKSSTESFEDFDRCMGAINDEHWTLHVSRCLTPHVCFSRLKREVDCVATRAEYDFFRSGSGYFLQTTNVSITTSDPNCEAPVPQIVAGNHYFAP